MRDDLVANLAGHDEVRQGHSLARVGQHDGERDALAREAVGRRLAARVKPLVVAGEGFDDAHPLTLLTASLCPTSFRHTVSKRMGLSTWMRSMIHRMAGFQWTASRIPRAAEGVMTSYETRSALNSGRVKHAYSPHTWSFTPQVRERRFRRAGAQRAPARGGRRCGEAARGVAARAVDVRCAGGGHRGRVAPQLGQYCVPVRENAPRVIGPWCRCRPAPERTCSSPSRG